MYRTVEALRGLVNQLGDVDDCTDKDLIWFVCCQRSSSLSDMTNREGAELFRDGIAPLTIDDVRIYLELFYDVVDVSDTSYESLLLKELVADWLGEHELEAEFRAQRQAIK